MPIYEYRCLDCQHRFSHFVRRMADADKLPSCPACGSTQVRRLVSRVSVHYGSSAATTDAASPEPEKPPVFGRKELEAARRQRQAWLEED